MFELKPISPESIPVALEKVELYRLLNESWLAESRSVSTYFVSSSENQKALLALLLDTDRSVRAGRAGELRPRDPAAVARSV